METIESNKLIAEFMGGIKSSVPNLIHLPQTIGQTTILCVKGSEGLPSGNYKVERINELQYYSSWDWLMPVVGKISDFCEEPQELDSLKYSLLSADIKTAYYQVVEFIKEFNNQN